MFTLRRCHVQDVTTLYTLGKVLGRGQFGVTRLAVDKATGEELACKSISKRKLLCAPLLVLPYPPGGSLTA